jgi:hypothetical protein
VTGIKDIHVLIREADIMTNENSVFQLNKNKDMTVSRRIALS